MKMATSLDVLRRSFATLSIAGASFIWTSSVGAAEKQSIWSDGNFHLYDEANSCAIYADYASDAMLRISYKGSQDKVFFGYYSPTFRLMQVGQTLTVSFTTEDDANDLKGYVATIVDNNGRKGIAGEAGLELLDHLQGASQVYMYGPLLLPVAQLDARGLDDAIKRMRRCGSEK